MTLYFRREYDRAITQLQKTLEIEPDYYLPHIFLDRSYVQLHMYDQAIAEQAGILSVWNRQKTEDLLNRLRAAYQAGGEQGLLREQIEILTKDSSPRFSSSIWGSRRLTPYSVKRTGPLSGSREQLMLNIPAHTP